MEGRTRFRRRSLGVVLKGLKAATSMEVVGGDDVVVI